MFDISIPWSVILLMAPVLLPFLSIPGALLSGYGWYRRKKNFYAALVAAVVGAFVPCWALLLAALAFDKLRELSQLGKVALAFVSVTAIVGLVLWGVGRAGSRRPAACSKRKECEKWA